MLEMGFRRIAYMVLAVPLLLDTAILKMCYFISLLIILKHDLSFVGD